MRRALVLIQSILVWLDEHRMCQRQIYLVCAIFLTLKNVVTRKIVYVYGFCFVNILFDYNKTVYKTLHFKLI